MKRGEGLKRSKALSPDSGSVRDWMRRSRENARLSRGGLPSRAEVEKRNPPKRHLSRRRDRLPGARGWTQRVFALYGRHCARCGGRAVQAHHAVPLQTIEARGADYLARFAYDARNGVPVCADCHWEHEFGARDDSRLPAACLPPGVVAWAIEEGFMWKIDATYRRRRT